MYQTRSCNEVTQLEFEWHKYPLQLNVATPSYNSFDTKI